MQRWLTLATVWFMVMAPAGARADTFDDCRRPPRPEARITACSAVIKDTQASTEQKAVAYRQRGAARMSAGALSEAIADFSEAIGLDPNAAAALSGRGQALLLSGDAHRARADYSAALRLSPQTSSLWLERGHVNLALGDADAAISDLNEAVRLSPRSATILNNRGLAYRKKGDLESAYTDYSAALALNPIYALAYANRGYLEEARGRKTEAVADLKAALLLDPSMTGASEALGRLGALDTWAQESRQRVVQGKALVETKCSICHAVGATGASPKAGAPEFRTLHQRHPLMALREPLTRGIAAPHDEMPRFALTNADIDHVVAYINSLAPRK